MEPGPHFLIAEIWPNRQVMKNSQKIESPSSRDDVLFSVNFFMKVLPVQANAGFCSSFAAQRTSIPWKGSAGTGCFEVFSSMHSQVSKCLKLPYEWTFLLYVCCTHVQPLPVRLLWLLASVEAGSCRAICLLHPFHFLWSQGHTSWLQRSGLTDKWWRIHRK